MGASWSMYESRYGSRGGVEPMVRLAVQLGAPAAVAEGWDALAVTGAMPTGGWR